MALLRTSQDERTAGEWARLIAFGVVAGILISIAMPVLVELGRKMIAIGVLSLGLLVVALASHRAREVFLFSWVITLTYNRQFWSFAPIVGDHGAFGPYWMISDLLLLVLLTIWLYQVIILKRPQHVQARSFLPWYAPFTIVAALSIVGAPEPVWSLGDFARLCKLGLVLMYFRYNVGRSEWWVVIAGLGAAVAIQSVLGILEVATGHTGVLWIFGLGGIEVQETAGVDVEQIFGGWTRATGTVAHPPYLAAFLLLTVPIFMALALTLRTKLHRWLIAGLTALGMIGLACSLTRLPIVLMMGQTLLLSSLLVGLRMVPITRIIAVSAFAGLLLSSVGLIGADFIHDRLNRDFKESIDQRVTGYKEAASMLRDHPFFGVGLNNYAAYMEEYGSIMVWGISKKWQDTATQITHMRLLPGPLNGFLYVATVTGGIGLITFLWLAFGGLVLGRRAVRSTAGPERAASLGMIVGMVGLYLHQSLSYSIWIDTVISVWIVLIALVGCAGFNTVRTRSFA